MILKSSKKEREKKESPLRPHHVFIICKQWQHNNAKCQPVFTWVCFSLKRLTPSEVLCFFVLFFSIQGEAKRQHWARWTGRIGPGCRVRNPELTCFSFLFLEESILVLKIILPSPQASCPGIKDICQPQLGAVKAARQEVRGLLVEGNAAAADPGSVSGRLLLCLLPLASTGRQCSWHSVI